MFTNPHLNPGETFPTVPVGTPEFDELITRLDIPFDPRQEVLPQLVGYTRGAWFNGATPGTKHAKPYSEVSQYDLLERSGVIHDVEPRRSHYDYALVDGGTMAVYQYRLGFVDKMLANGITSDVTLFGGQRKRFGSDDNMGKLETLAEQALANGATGWNEEWLRSELSKPRDAYNPWDRSFAAEQEVATLALIHRYGNRLQHARTLKRDNPRSEVSSIPDAPILTEEFLLDGQHTIRVLYGKAITRSYAGQEPYTPRPTARSCFAEWLDMAKPPLESSVLMVTHNPNIYRSWLDVMLGTVALNRTDLRVDGAGPAIESNRSYNYVLRAIASIFINYHSHIYGNDGSHLQYTSWRN